MVCHVVITLHRTLKVSCWCSCLPYFYESRFCVEPRKAKCLVYMPQTFYILHSSWFNPMAPLPHSDTASFLTHIRTTGLHLGGLCPPQSLLYSDTPPPRQPSFRLAQAVFEPILFPCKYPNILIPVIFPTYTAYEVGTVCHETSAYKIQKPGNHPKERIQHFTFFFFFFFFFLLLLLRHNFILWTFWPSQHIISTYCDPGCS